MRFRWTVLRSLAALVIALAAGHLAQTVRPRAVDPDAVQATAMAAPVPAPVGIPLSASLGGGSAGPGPALVGITSVAAEIEAAVDCPAEVALAARPGAIIELALAAPCNRGERIVVRHAGLSFTARTDATGIANLQFPALQTDALVAVYLEGSALALGRVDVPEAGQFRRFAIQWSASGHFDLRVTEDDRVFVGGDEDRLDPAQRKIMSLGSAAVQQPMFAKVYTYPPLRSTAVDLTVELRIGPETCGQTLATRVLSADRGKVAVRDYPVAVPLCGTSGDILVLKNLAPDPKLATPR